MLHDTTISWLFYLVTGLARIVKGKATMLIASSLNLALNTTPSSICWQNLNVHLPLFITNSSYVAGRLFALSSRREWSVGIISNEEDIIRVFWSNPKQKVSILSSFFVATLPIIKVQDEVHSHAPSIRSHRGQKWFFQFSSKWDSQENRVCIFSFRQNPVFASLYLRSPVHVVPPLLGEEYRELCRVANHQKTTNSFTLLFTLRGNLTLSVQNKLWRSKISQIRECLEYWCKLGCYISN